MTGRLKTSITRACLLSSLMVVGGFVLSGCANVGDSFASGAFMDPAKYDQYDCNQLESARKALTTRTAELQGWILKAETGAGGAVIGEMVYRNDYISTRAQAKSVEEMWQRNKCVATQAAAATPISPPSPSAATRAKR